MRIKVVFPLFLGLAFSSFFSDIGCFDFLFSLSFIILVMIYVILECLYLMFPVVYVFVLKCIQQKMVPQLGNSSHVLTILDQALTNKSMAAFFVAISGGTGGTQHMQAETRMTKKTSCWLGRRYSKSPKTNHPPRLLVFLKGKGGRSGQDDTKTMQKH